jgi:ABC-type branched-subunit amino acid transport system ATPase component
MLAVLKAQHAAGLTIVLVDHDIESVASVVERMVVLSNGKLIADGPPQEVTRSPAVVEAYLGRRWRDAGN